MNVWLAAALGVLLTRCDGLVTAADCSSNEVAQNASILLKWTLLAGDETFTRISHTSEALVAPSPSVGDRLVIIGGIEYESAQPTVVNPLLVYSLNANTFAKPKDAILSSLTPQQPTTSSKRVVDDKFASPASRVDHASFVRSNVVYVFGGQNKEFLNDTWRLCLDDSSTTASWDQLVAASDAITLAATPVPRVGHSFTQVFENATMIGALVYGGISDAYTELDGLHMAFIARPLSPGCSDRSPKVTWRMLPAAPVSLSVGAPSVRAFHSAMTTSVLFSSTSIVCLLVYGGKNAQQGIIFDELWRLCPPATATPPLIVEKQVHTWELLKPLGTTPGARYGSSVAFIDEGKIALSGGSYTFPNDFLRDTWELDVNATQWVRLSFDEDYTPPRRGHSLTFFQASRKLFVLGGKDRYVVVQKRLETTLYAAPYCKTGLRIALCEVTGMYVCIPCPAGTFLQSGTRNCVSCPQGTFSGVGAAECTKCPTGTYSTAVGKTSATPCTSCPVGTASSALGASTLATCLACQAGTFASSPGSSACATCPSGFYSNASAAACSLCKPGEWSAAGAPRCLSCTAGSFNPNSGSSTCFACPKGFVSGAGLDKCIPCPINWFTNSIGAADGSCQRCPQFSFTSVAGQTPCQICGAGYSYNNVTCQPCSPGSYSTMLTSGVCQPCPIGSYTPNYGSAQCSKCPAGSTTLNTAAKAISECTFCSSGQFLDGNVCSSCTPGSFAFPSGFCTKCAPGSYTSSATEASRSDNCVSCPAMTYSGSEGATRCNACADTTFSLTGWKSCIACGLTEQQLLGCKLGRNGVMCSGTGRCVYGGCACNDGWSSADCSAPTSASTTSTNTPVLYFPKAQTVLVEFPVSKSAGEAAVLIARSGRADVTLRALVHWTSSNFSNAPSGFPMTVSLDAGVLNYTVKMMLTSLAPRASCRFFTLTLRDVANASPSAVSVESDSLITVFVDDMNDADGGGASPRPVSERYTADYSLERAASVRLDRVATTQATLSPTTPSTAESLLQRLNILVAVDRRSASSIVYMLPALVAQLQTRYSVDRGIQLGLLVGNTSSVSSPPSAVFYRDTAEFFAAAARLVTSSSQQDALSWEWMAAGLLQNASAWPSTDRRFLWVCNNYDLTLSATSPSSAALAFQAAARSQSVFSFFLQPPTTSPLSRGNTIAFTGVESLMQPVLFERNEVLPTKMLEAHQARDAALPTQIDIVADRYALITSSQVLSFASGPGSLPVLKLLFALIPTAASYSSALANVTLGIPGLFQLNVSMREPSRACAPPANTPPADPQLFSGWLDAWTPSSLAEVRRQWRSSSATLNLQMYADSSSLFRTAASTVLVLSDSQKTRITLVRTISGMDFSAGLSFVLRGYMRTPSLSYGNAVICHQKITMISSNGTVEAAITHSSALSGGKWRYGWLQRIVPWDLDRVDVTLDCNMSVPGLEIEWSTLGLLPDPAFACKCPRGFFNDVLSTGNADGECVRCPAGSYCAAGVKRRCPNGSFSFGKAPSCEVCRDGWICIDGSARLCGPGTYAAPAGTCEVCPAGYACQNGKKRSCVVGTFSRQQASDCESCPPGTISRLEACVLTTLCSADAIVSC